MGEGSSSGPSGAKSLLAVREQKIVWERMDMALSALNQAQVESDVPRESWSKAQWEAADRKVLTALQAPDPNAEILGVSRFRTVDFERPNDGDLAKMGSKIGARLVIWSSRYAGKGSKVSRETVFSQDWDTDHYYDPHSGRYRRSVFPDQRTSSVPVVVEADEFEFVAFWLR
jgi:hypothetical protein